MADAPALLIRQKTDKLEIFCPALQKRNKYKIAVLADVNNPEFDQKWSDSTFKSLPDAMKAKEESDFCCRVFCMNMREFTMDISGGDNVVYKIHRPFKCSIYCCCILLNPQELTISDDQGNVIGRTVHDFRCMPACCGKTYLNVEDKDGAVQYQIEHNVCCNANMLNPAYPCCFPINHFGIYNADMTQEVGSLENIFPGCNFRGLCAPEADNYKLTFPTDATPDQKAMLLGSTMLIEFLFFEKSAEDE